MLEMISHPVLKQFQRTAHINESKYKEMYQASIEDPDRF